MSPRQQARKMNKETHHNHDPRSERPQFRTTPEIMERAHRLAEERRWTLSVLCEEALKDYLDREEAQ